MIKPWYERLDFPFARTFDVDGEVSTTKYCDSLSSELEQYVKNFYEPDYKLIELVNFQNK